MLSDGPLSSSAGGDVLRWLASLRTCRCGVTRLHVWKGCLLVVLPVLFFGWWPLMTRFGTFNPFYTYHYTGPYRPPRPLPSPAELRTTIAAELARGWRPRARVVVT